MFPSTDHSTQPSCQEGGKPGDVPTDDNDEEKEEDSIPLFRQLLGHPLACYQVDSGCKSKLRVLRSAAPHYPLMCKLAIRCHRIMTVLSVQKILKIFASCAALRSLNRSCVYAGVMILDDCRSREKN